jgi:hypothetical protein
MNFRFTRHACAYAATVWLWAMSESVWAHHGRDFLLIQSAHIPEAGTGYLIGRQDYIDREEGHEYEFEPGLVVGTTDWLTLELHGHIAKEEHESSRHESTAAVAYVRFTPRSSALSLGATAEYADAADNEANDELAGAMLLSYQIGGWIAALNLDVSHETNVGAGNDWGLRGGLRRNFTRQFALGFEVVDTFDRRDDREVMLGAYFQPLHTLTFNVGTGTGYDGGPDFTLRTSLIWQFGGHR